MKIAVITPGFSERENDWCIPALLDFVRALAMRAEVHVFTLRWPERGGTYSVFGATVHALDGRGHLGLRVTRLYGRALQAIASEHRRAPFSALHAFWADEPGWIAALAGQWLGIPVVVSLAGGELVGLRDIGYGLQLLPVRNLLIRYSLRRARSVTVGSDYYLRLARAYLGSDQYGKLVRAPLGVDTHRFSPALENRSGRAVLNVGTLYPVKGQSLLLRALAHLSKVGLEIVGSGPLQADLSKLADALGIGGRVKFMGEVDHGNMPRIYRAAGVFVQSSRHEAQGMAVLEAAACGVCVAGTPVGVLPELGVTADNELDLAEKLGELLVDNARRRALGEAARARIESEFSLRQSVERFIGLYLQ